MDENEKIWVLKKNKKQANLSEIFKPGLITKTCNIWNSRSDLNKKNSIHNQFNVERWSKRKSILKNYLK
jgi:hypothetical protein